MSRLPFTVSKLEASLHIFKEYVYFSVSHRKNVPLAERGPCSPDVGTPGPHGALRPRRWPVSRVASLYHVFFASVLTPALPGTPQLSFCDPSHVTASLKHLEHPSLMGPRGCHGAGGGEGGMCVPREGVIFNPLGF